MGCIWDDIDEIIEIVPKEENLLGFEDITGSNFTMIGQDLGETIVTVVGKEEDNTVHQNYLNVSVENISTLHASCKCSVSISDEEVFLVPTDSEIEFFYTIDGDQYANWNRPLQGQIDIDFDGLTEIDHDHDSRRVHLLTHSSPSEHLVTSIVWPDVLAEIEVYQEGDFDGLVLSWTGPETMNVGSKNWLLTSLQNEGRSVCIESEIREITILTPDICDLDGEGTFSEETDDTNFLIHAIASGECRLKVDIVERGLSENFVLNVDE